MCWQGCGGQPGVGQAALNLPVRWEWKRGPLRGPSLTSGRTDDRSRPFKEEALPTGSVSVADRGDVDWANVAARRAAGSDTLTRAPANTASWTPDGQRWQLERVRPQHGGQSEERWVRVGTQQKHLMRVLLLRVPAEVAERRRASLKADAVRRQQPLRQRTWELADWTILLPDAQVSRLSLPEALVLLRERWHMERLSKRWKQDGQGDEWRTTNSWRVWCERPAKLLGLLLQHWLLLLLAWHDEQRRVVKLAQVVRETACSLMEALAGLRSLRSALRIIRLSMGSGTQMNKRRNHPNAAQVLLRGSPLWEFGPYVGAYGSANTYTPSSNQVWSPKEEI